jgi:hypothetical protein
MVRVTRQRAREQASPSTASATPVESPMFSNKSSVHSETPFTSDIDEDIDEPVSLTKRLAKTRIASNTKKRRARSENEDDGGSDARPSTKRRVMPRKRIAYVEIPANNRKAAVSKVGDCM